MCKKNEKWLAGIHLGWTCRLIPSEWSLLSVSVRSFFLSGIVIYLNMLISYDWFVDSFLFSPTFPYIHTFFKWMSKIPVVPCAQQLLQKAVWFWDSCSLCERNLEFTKANTLVRGRQSLTHLKPLWAKL